MTPAPEPHAPTSEDPQDHLLVSRWLNGASPWLDPAERVPYGHLISAAAALRCAPADVVSRLAALGYHDVQIPDGRLPASVAAEDAALVESVDSGRGSWVDVTVPVSLRQTVVLADRLQVSPAEVARRLTALGYHYPAGSGPLPETRDARDLLLIRKDRKGYGAWLDQGEEVRAGHVLQVAAELKCGPHAAALRLTALGVRLPYTPDPVDDRLLHTGAAGDEVHHHAAAWYPGHVLAVARETGRRPADVLARLQELGCWIDPLSLPDAPEEDDFVILSEGLDGHSPWLRVNSVVGVQLRHVLRAALVTGRSPAETAERLASLGHVLHENARLPETADEEDVRLLETVDRSFKDGVHLEHVLRSAGLTGRSPADVAERLSALGYRLPDEVEYPEVRAVLRG
ncbi:hypothetical protein [Streptomyces sp. NRRL WC-3549]|uniref:wHTH domain-containing protein n=1 Tax=Streptomyces sp. NRRL WC-3549 TaxID=1463925 RepID=UPI0004CB5D04|nr:hypothetical protein [Streptomyces sp. NRRL WC-3549]